jgi:hypothetical protein
MYVASEAVYMHIDSDNIVALEIAGLRALWSKLWGKEPHRYIRRDMLEKGILFKKAELGGKWLNAEQQTRLSQLIKQYKRDSVSFDQKKKGLNLGSKVVRVWRGQKYIVIVTEKGFGYNGEDYSSLSQVAFVITGTRWNGWVFFGLKNEGKKKNETAS